MKLRFRLPLIYLLVFAASLALAALSSAVSSLNIETSVFSLGSFDLPVGLILAMILSCPGVLGVNIFKISLTGGGPILLIIPLASIAFYYLLGLVLDLIEERKQRQVVSTARSSVER